MPDTPPPTRPTLRLKLAALSTVGVAMVVLPLAQVLHYQDAQLQSALQEQAALDPLARAVTVQRSLLAHRDVAGRVLRGQLAFEAERQARQREVDAHVARLAAVPAVLASGRALDESTALRDDWTLLARQVGQRAITAGESDFGHRLLVEQTLQLIDLVADASGLGRGPDAEAALLASLATRGLPRLAAEIAGLGSAPADADAGAGERRRAATESALARSLRRLNASLEASPVPRPMLASAAADAGAAAGRYFALLREPAGTDAAPALMAALQAQFRLQDAARDAVAEAIDRRVADTRLERSLLLALSAVLALMALALVRRVFAPPGPPSTGHRTHPAPLYEAIGDSAGVGRPAAERRAGGRRRSSSDDEAARLLQRLRQSPQRGRSGRHSDWHAETRPPEEP